MIVEDDIITSPYMLNYFSKALNKYWHEPAVFTISAWSPPPSCLHIPPTYTYDAYFIPRSNVWGWGIWRDRWNCIDWEIKEYEMFIKNDILRNAFNQGGRDLCIILQEQFQGKIDAWDIRMDYARFKHGCLSLNPVRSYTTNIGMGSGTHTVEATTRYDNDIKNTIPFPNFPDHIFVEEKLAEKYRKVYEPFPLWKRAINKAVRSIGWKNFYN